MAEHNSNYPAVAQSGATNERSWHCPEHPSGPVEWRGDVAYCQSPPGCANNSWQPREGEPVEWNPDDFETRIGIVQVEGDPNHWIVEIPGGTELVHESLLRPAPAPQQAKIQYLKGQLAMAQAEVDVQRRRAESYREQVRANEAEAAEWKAQAQELHESLDVMNRLATNHRDALTTLQDRIKAATIAINDGEPAQNALDALNGDEADSPA